MPPVKIQNDEIDPIHVVSLQAPGDDFAFDNISNVINDSASLLKRPFSEKSNVELVEALRSNFSSAKDAGSPLEYDGNLLDGVLPNEDMDQKSAARAYDDLWTSRVADSIFIPSIDFSSSGLSEERAQYDITVKLFFLPDSSVPKRNGQVRQAIDLVLEELHISSIDLLIVSFPGITFEPTSECPDDAAGHGSTSMDTIAETWECLEGLQSRGLVERIGIAEFGQQRLQEFISRITVRPAVDQINVRDVCLVPKELVAYSKTQNIDLFTHSDCTNILPQGTIRKLLGSSGAGIFADSDENPKSSKLKGDIQPQWVIKYTAVVQNRGVIENKGYFAMAELVE